MSADPCDFDNDDFDWMPDRSVMGEWLQMNFPVGCFAVHSNSLDPDPRLYLTIEFESGNAAFILKETENEEGLRGPNDHTICWFTMSPDLLNRISRVARS
jgi:hypothetical protein